MNTNITWSVALKCPLALTFWLLFSFSSIAQVAFVGSADGTGNFTIPSGTNRLLLVQSCAFGTSGSPMFNGMPLTLALRRSAPVAGDLEIWYLSIPGTASVTSSVSGLAGTPHSSWYSGVDPTNPIAGMTSRSGSGTSSSLMLPALADGIIYSGVFRKDGDAINPGGGQTETFDAIFNSSSSRCEGSYKTSVAGANTVSVTGANGFTMAVAHIAVFIQKPCVDAVAPTIMCPGAQNVFFDASCQASLPNYISSTTVSDDCDVAPVVTQSPTAGTMISMPTSVTMTAMDASGKSSMCSFTVTPVDNTSPTLTCPGNMSVSNAGGTCGAVVNYTTPMASDNCGVVGGVSCVPASGYTFPVGTTTVTCTASDAAGNMGTCTFTVTVNDTEDPVIGSCPGTVMVSNTPGLCSGFATFTAPMATDNCPGVSVSCSPASGSNFPVGNNTVTCTATDAAGNTDVCTFTVTVNDTEAPSIICPTNITMSNDAGMCGAVVTFTPTATDNCPGVTYTCVPASGTLFPVGTTTVTCTATDAAGNMDVCTFTVTVNDMEDPNITCPSNITVSNDAGMCGTVVTFTPTAADNCPGVTYTCLPASGTLFPVGTTTVTCTATDASGNMEVCTFTVTVNDTEDPNITCPANITVSNDAGMCGAVVTYTTPTPMDNCTGVSVSCVPASGTFFAVGTTTVNCTATDMAGNTTTCMFDVTVSDTAAPGWEIASMGMPIADNNTMSPATETYDLGVIECDSTSIFTASGVDNCDGPITPSNALQLVSLTTVNGSTVLPSSIAITDDAMGNYSLAINWGVGTTTIVLSMSDALGNSSNLTLTATTIDTEPPFWQITDESMLRIADNDPLSPEPLDADLGMLTIDQNECGAMGTYFASGVDSCEGAVTSSMALSIVSIVSGSAVSPTTATLSNDGSGNYTIIVSWGVGTSTVSLALQDGSGNAENLSLTATVPDPFAGNIQPNANGINPAMDQNGDVSFQLFEIVRNASCSDLVDVVIETMSGVRVYSATGLIRNSLITFNACPYRGQQLKATFTASGGSAWGYITIKSGSDPIIDHGTSKDIYCFDSLILSEPSVGDFPKAYTPCGAQLPVSFVADWIEVHDCSSDQFSSENDTLKVIYREYEAFDKNGRRTTSTDTFTVFRMPAIDVVNTPNVYCSEKDTFYCGVGNAGPYMVYSERCDPLLFGQDQDTDGSVCDTFYFLTYNDSLNRYLVNPLLEKSKCGILLHLDYLNFEKNSCDETTKYTLEIKQECIPSSDVSCFVDPLLQASNAFEEISQGYFKCEFWTINLDTLPPLIDCKDDNLLLTTVYTGTHDCSANTYVPPAYVNDDWSGVKQVKATIEDIGTAIMTFNPEKKCYEGHTPFKLPHRVLPYKVLYEAYDSCHNIGYDSCYIRVKDGTDPIAISDKGVTVSLSNKKVWVEAKTFNEGSWDNCGINMLLARRSDWYDFCINLCDSIDDCWVGEHGDTIWQSILQEDKHLDEVEAHYAKTLEWLCEDNQACGDVIYNAWQYDLMKHATLDCIEHPYEVGEDYFRGLIKNAVLDPVFARKWKNPSTLFIGSANNPAGADNNAYYVSMNGSATNVLDAFPIWGATTDFEQKRILFSTSFESDKGDQLYALPFGGVAPVKIGTITSDGTTPLRMDGLAFKDGKLYGALDNGTNDGIFIIDLSTLIATKIITYSDISGIDTDPISGKIYGADDGSRKIVEINVTNNSITAIADYPAGVTDIDGVAVGNGKIFLVTDEPGFIYVYNLASKAYDAPIISPFGEDDTFSGGAAYMPMLEDLIDEWSQIGGGWSDAVPFSCEDACGPVTVEILVMDYWCNWSTAWTKVWVEDLTPVDVAKDVVDETISCKVYKENNYSYPGEEHPVSIQYIIDQAQIGEQDAYDALDAIFGGYVKAWKDPYGNYVDSAGSEIDCDIPFYDSICDCKKIETQVRVYDEHLGYLWIDSIVTECFYEADTLNFQAGVVAVNCAENVYCEQEVWSDFDHCGQGYIFRKFKIWQSCPEGSYDGMPDSLRHPVDTIYRHQRIWVGNECPLDKYMFDVPYDTAVISCNIDYGPDGNVIGDAGPENTGYPKYKFDDDCRLVGIAHEDKVFKVVGGEEACYKILRTWYFADWCGAGADSPGGIPDGKWWLDDRFIADKCVQKIIVVDTVAPVCLITGPVESGDSVSLSGCDYNLNVSVDASDACGVISYRWELKDITNEVDPKIFDSGIGVLEGDVEGVFSISSQGLSPGTYTLRVRISDDCSNESYCEYLITVTSGKKPSPVCLSSITARLTPWDSDDDGEVDTAHAIIWASEYDRSSEPACADDSLEYRIEILDGLDDDETAAGDLDFLEVGCNDIGTHLVRFWVISHPSGSRDYCDAVLVVQSDGSGCPTSVNGEQVLVTERERAISTKASTQKNLSADDHSVVVSGEAFGSGIDHIEGYNLDQNSPNPFTYETQIGFSLPESMEARIEVYDLTGKLIKTITGSYTKGHNTVFLTRNDLRNIQGLIYYRLSAGDFLQTKRMILIE